MISTCPSVSVTHYRALNEGGISSSLPVYMSVSVFFIYVPVSLGDIDVIAEARAKEVSNFLEMLDTSGNRRPSDIHGAQQKEWKVCN